MKLMILKHLEKSGPIKLANTRMTLPFVFSRFQVVFSICSASMTTQGSLAWRARVDERITMPKGNIGQHDLDTPISASRRIAFTRPLEVPKFHLQQSQQALQGRLCEITAPILRGIDLPLMRNAIIEAALGFMKQPPAAKNTQCRCWNECSRAASGLR
jgi:hypothetical protein